MRTMKAAAAVLMVSAFTVCGHTTDLEIVTANLGRETYATNGAVGLWLQGRDGESAVREVFQWFEDCLVFDGCSDDVSLARLFSMFA